MKNLGKVALFLLLGSIPCFSATLYTDRSMFLAAVGPTANIDFEGLAPLGANADFLTAAGLTQSGVNFVGTSTTCHVPPLSNPPGPTICDPADYSLNVKHSHHNEW